MLEESLAQLDHTFLDNDGDDDDVVFDDGDDNKIDTSEENSINVHGEDQVIDVDKRDKLENVEESATKIKITADSGMGRSFGIYILLK